MDNHNPNEDAQREPDPSNAEDAANGDLYGVLAEFDTPGELIDAARKVRDAGFTEFDCYSPFPVHGIDDAMGIKRTVLPLLVFGGGCAGLLLGLLLQWWTNAYDWPWLISGKPFWSVPANIPIGFETTILLSVFTTFFGMWILNRLPQVWHPFFRLDRFARGTDDAFLLGIEARDGKFQAASTTELLKGAGAIAVEECYLDARPESKKLPAWVYGFIVSTGVLALVPFAIIAKARASTSTEPHYHIFGDMDFQPKVKSDATFPLFADGRGNRGELTGTIPRGGLNADDVFYRGLVRTEGVVDASWTTELPPSLEVDMKLLERGRQRYDIYCSPCHGYDGRGNGAIPRRVQAGGGAWVARNLVDPQGAVAKMPNGQLFNTISNGFNTMMGYAAQIPHLDRWAVVLYVRALQRAQNAGPQDVPADCRNEVR
ncbi:MAG: quinol:electron acceptor oxidoreductase subunit ActD [Kofleriaceae bacterium]